MVHSWQGVLLYKGFTLFSPKDTFFGGAQIVTFWFPKLIAPKGFRLLDVFFSMRQMLNFVLRS